MTEVVCKSKNIIFRLLLIKHTKNTHCTIVSKIGPIWPFLYIHIVHAPSDSRFVAIKDVHYYASSSYYCFVAFKNYPLFAYIEYERWQWNKSALQFLFTQFTTDFLVVLRNEQAFLLSQIQKEIVPKCSFF